MPGRDNKGDHRAPKDVRRATMNASYQIINRVVGFEPNQSESLVTNTLSDGEPHYPGMKRV